MKTEFPPCGPVWSIFANQLLILVTLQTFLGSYSLNWHSQKIRKILVHKRASNSTITYVMSDDFYIILSSHLIWCEIISRTTIFQNLMRWEHAEGVWNIQTQKNHITYNGTSSDNGNNSLAFQRIRTFNLGSQSPLWKRCSRILLNADLEYIGGVCAEDFKRSRDFPGPIVKKDNKTGEKHVLCNASLVLHNNKSVWNLRRSIFS